MFLPRGVLGRDVQGVEVVPVGFDLRAFGDGKAHIGEDRGQFLHHLGDRMDRAHAARPGGQGDVEPFRAQAGVKGGIAKRGLFGAQGGVDFILEQVEHGAGGFALIGVHLAKARHQCRDLALFAKGGQPQLFQPGLARDIGNGGQIFGFEIV